MEFLFIGSARLFLVLLMFVLLAGTSLAQNARLDFERLSSLESRAENVVEVNVDGRMLDLARGVMAKTNEKDAQRIAEALKGLKGIYVRVYSFDKQNQYQPADIEQIRQQLNAPGWEKVANVRSRKDNQRVDVFAMFEGTQMSGVAVLVAEETSIAVVNIVGPIDLEMLAELSGNLSIPKIDVVKEGKN